MERVTARGCAAPLALLVLAASGCGGDAHKRLLEGWERGGREVSQSQLQLSTGPSHCEWDDAVVLSLRWPLEGPDTASAWSSFVRDPDDGLAEYTAASFDADAELPDDAVRTGFTNAEVELWLAGDHSTAYLVDGNTVEAWPAVEPFVCA
jgi:hypothetical protein